MLWFDRHTRFRRRLSPYIDGQLSPSERATLEAHLAACDGCRLQLDQLRATISAVGGGLVDVEPPRSFALTPRLLEQRATAPPASVPAMATGMRLAGAAVALVLAVVVIGDLGGVGDGNTRDESSESRQTADFGLIESDTTAAGAPAPVATGAAEEYAEDATDRASPEDLAASADKTEQCPGGGAGSSGRPTSAAGVGEDAPVLSPVPEPSLSPAPAATPGAAGAGGPAACAPAVADVAPEASTPANVEPLREGDEGELAAAAPSSQGGDGVSALTVLEIVLAGTLVALLGGVGIEYMLRRRVS